LRYEAANYYVASSAALFTRLQQLSFSSAPTLTAVSPTRGAVTETTTAGTGRTKPAAAPSY